jgi:dihydroorotate dehydrogenase (NAD+) catalytic subunit
MFKQDLTFRTPYMNAAGTLGFAPDYRAPVPWDSFGAFVTNPISLRPRKPAKEPALIEYPGGILIHTGLPNPGLTAAIKKYARRWADSRLPIIVHLMADSPEGTGQMVQALEELENIAAVELGFAPMLEENIILSTIEMSLGELPVIVSLAAERVLSLGPRVMQAGAAAISLAPPRGMILLENGHQVTGRLHGAGLFPQSLLAVRDAIQVSIPIIGAGGVGSKENADAMLSVGALAVQADVSLWKGDVRDWAPTP